MRYAHVVAFIAAIASSTNALAETYYVKQGGSDSADGLSHASAWKTLSKVKSHSFQTGDDVYFLAGDQWDDRLVIDWSGTNENRVIIGSYHMSNGSEIVGYPGNTRKPTFSGTYKQLGDKINTATAIPSTQYEALVEVKGNYVTVQDIRAINSAGVGMSITTKGGYHHAIFHNNEVDFTAGSSITLQRKSYSNIMRKNRMRRCVLSWKDGQWNGPTWPVCSGAIGSKDNLIEENFVSESYGEGIVAFAVGSNGNTIRKNTIFANRSAAIYVDNASNTLVESNLILGEQHPGTYTTKEYNGGGLNLAVEEYVSNVSATGNIFRNNLIAHVKNCIGIIMQQGARDAGHQVGGKFLGNTCVNTQYNVRIFPEDKNIESIEIANNIFMNTALGSNACEVGGAGNNIKFNNNFWTDLPSNSKCKSSNDITGQLTLKKATGWDKLVISQLPLPDDFTPASGSSIANKGIPHADLQSDFFGMPRSTSTDIGAINISAGNIAILSPPTGVSLSIISPL